MKSTITNAAEITVLQPIDNNYKTGGGDNTVSGAVVVARKGRPFTAYKVYGATGSLVNYFGKPLAKKTQGMEGLRHVNDAAQECTYVQTVRVVDPLTYRFPVVSLLLHKDLNAEWAEGAIYQAGDVVGTSKKYIAVADHTATAENAPTVENTAMWAPYSGPVNATGLRWDTEPAVGDGAFLTIYPIDGDDSANRKLYIEDVDAEKKTFTIRLTDLDDLGEEYDVEEHTVSVDPEAVDDMGLSSYVETVLERDSDILRADFDENVTWENVKSSLTAIETTRTAKNPIAFTGGNAGSYPDTQDWIQALQVFRNESLPLNMLFAAGCYDETVLAEMAAIADFRHISFFFDVPPSQKAESAVTWLKALGLRSRHARAYYAPYAATDPWYGGTTVWGVSGAQAAAKARCVNTVTSGATPGVHYAPAGLNRAYFSRTSMTQIFPTDVIDRDEFYDARLNPVVTYTTGDTVTDDDLTMWPKSNYLRFGWINDVLDYIDHRFEEGARQLKFEPDGLTRNGLMRMMTGICDEMVTSGALVEPRNPSVDGTAPYVVTVEQVEIDLWKVTWEVCITGAARRIVGQPKLIK